MILPSQSNTLKPLILGAASNTLSNPGRLAREGDKAPSQSSQRSKNKPKGYGIKYLPNGKGVIAYFGSRGGSQGKQEKPLTVDQMLHLVATDGKAACLFIALLRASLPLGSVLGLSSVANLRKSTSESRKPRGRKGITRKGKEVVGCVAAILGRVHHRTRLTFGTVTLPTLPRDLMHTILLSWPTLTNRFFEELGRELRRKGLGLRYVYVSEIQEERWIKTGDPALHFHFLCVGRKRRADAWALTPAKVTDIWLGVLRRFLGKSFAPDMSACVRLEAPKGQMAKELSKYLSKGCKVVSEVEAAGLGDLLPRTWWGCSRELRRAVDKSTFYYKSPTAWQLHGQLELLRSAGRISFHHIFAEGSAQDRFDQFYRGTSFAFRDWRDGRDFLSWLQGFASQPKKTKV